MMMVTMMVNVCDDDCYLVMKVILVKEVMSCDVSPVAMFYLFVCLFDFCHKNDLNYKLNILGPLCLWQCFTCVSENLGHTLSNEP